MGGGRDCEVVRVLVTFFERGIELATISRTLQDKTIIYSKELRHNTPRFECHVKDGEQKVQYEIKTIQEIASRSL